MHAIIRATILPQILQLIGEKYHLCEEDAMDKFFKSQTGAAFAMTKQGYTVRLLFMFMDCLLKKWKIFRQPEKY